MNERAAMLADVESRVDETRSRRSASRVGTLIIKSELLEANLQNGTSRAHQPSSFWTRKGYRPVSGHTGQREPGVSLIRSPGRSSRIGRNHHSAAAVVSFLSSSLSLSLSFLIAAVADRPHITQAENRSGYWRMIGELPGLAAVVGGGRRSVIGIVRV